MSEPIRTRVPGNPCAEAALRQARHAMLEAARAKAEFVANVSHEVRTPMTAILGMTDLALETELTAEQREYLTAVRSAADELLALLEDLLDFSALDACRLAVQRVPFSLRESVGDSVRTHEPRAQDRDLALTCEIAPSVPDAVVGDPRRLRQVIEKLVDNAIKFTAQGGVAVRVDAEVAADEVLLHCSVADTGIGIPREQQETIFEPFVQGDGSATRRYGGTGLGLAIASDVVQLMGGNIWVESEAGRGSTFHFTARLAQEPLSPPAPDRRPAPLRGGAGGLHVLLAEDNAVNRKVAVRLLEKRGHTVVAVEDGRQALRALDGERFDIALMDVQMPEMDGFEATAAVRARERVEGGHLPIVALTAYAMKGDRERCLEAGMDAYVAKPVNADELFATLERLVPGAGR
ncbi:MAG: response regulator [Deltaproteobacteria bacterium]|nr:MAG: response regulator [Deltaproteobacteria bacterium]